MISSNDFQRFSFPGVNSCSTWCLGTECVTESDELVEEVVLHVQHVLACPDLIWESQSLRSLPVKLLPEDHHLSHLNTSECFSEPPVMLLFWSFRFILSDFNDFKWLFFLRFSFRQIGYESPLNRPTLPPPVHPLAHLLHHQLFDFFELFGSAWTSFMNLFWSLRDH